MSTHPDADDSPPMEMTISLPWERRVVVRVSVQDRPILDELGTPDPRAPRMDEWKLILRALANLDLENLDLDSIAPVANGNS